MNWIEQLRYLLCQMYQEWGGDCKDLGIEPPEWVQTVTAMYAAEGDPTFENEAEEATFLQLLTDLEVHLALPQNTLSAADNQKLRDLIASLRNSLPPIP